MPAVFCRCNAALLNSAFACTDANLPAGLVADLSQVFLPNLSITFFFFRTSLAGVDLNLQAAACPWSLDFNPFSLL